MISDAKPSEGSPPSYSAPSVSELGSSSTPINRNQQAQLPPLPEKQAHPTSLADLGKDYQAQLFAQCALGNHQASRQYGMCGIITAIFLFPLGLVCLFADSHEKCSRCGERLRG